ncbi:dTDP-glucose 4,6-dehydratase [Micromonospora coerulea]
MSSIMITGGAGFIGSHFTKRWAAEHPGDRIVVVDALTYAGDPRTLADVAGEVILVQADIGDREAMERTLREHRIEVIVNFAAESHNSRAVLGPSVFFQTNVLGTQTLLDAALRHGVGRFHHISTCEVYGDLSLDSDESFTEESPYRPRTPYSASKAGADHVVRAYHQTYGLPVTISNCVNNYGPYQFPEKVLPLFVSRALRGESLPLYRSTGNRREWIHAVDHCRAIESVLANGRVGETYHVGTGVEASIAELADLVLSELGLPDSRKQVVPDRPGHDRRYVLNWTKIRTELGWTPSVPFEDGVRETIRWYVRNPAWWEPLLERTAVTETQWG